MMRHVTDDELRRLPTTGSSGYGRSRRHHVDVARLHGLTVQAYRSGSPRQVWQDGELISNRRARMILDTRVYVDVDNVVRVWPRDRYHIEVAAVDAWLAAHPDDDGGM